MEISHEMISWRGCKYLCIPGLRMFVCGSTFESGIVLRGSILTIVFKNAIIRDFVATHPSCPSPNKKYNGQV